MKKIAIIGANDFQNPLIQKAKEFGYETHVFAWKDGSIGETTADYFYPISIIEKEKILEKCKEIKIDGITTIASDLATITVNYIADKLNLVGNSLICTNKSTNKYEMRKAFVENQIPTIKFQKISSIKDLNNLDNLNFPLIVKPTDRSGSRAITKITKKDELEHAIEKAIDNSFEKKAIIEEFIEGKEYSAEGISFNGTHKFLTITEKQTTGSPHFIETGHIEPAFLSEEMKSKIYKELEKALNALEITNSATHSEFKITPNNEIRIIEIGARMGGDCIGSDLVQLSTGHDYIKMVIDIAMGNKPNFNNKTLSQVSAIKFIFTQKDLQDFKKAQKLIPQNIYRTSKFEKIGSHQVIDSSTRFGFYILKAKSFKEIGWLFNNEY